MEFYKSVLGGELTLMPNGDGPSIMHARLESDGMVILASDGTRTTPYEPSFISLTLGGSDNERLTKIFGLLSNGGTVTSDLKVEMWGDTFGSLTDKYGVDWQINITAK
jgi:PhnB protein